MPIAPASLDPAFDRDQFLLRQKFLAISEKYDVWDAEGNTILYIERPAHFLRNLGAGLAGLVAGLVTFILLILIASVLSNRTISVFLIILATFGWIAVNFIVTMALYQKRHVTFYRDNSKQERLLEILQDKKVEWITTTYTVIDASGQLLARLRKNYLFDLVRKRWQCLTPEGNLLCVAKEDSLILALLRRLIGVFFGVLRTNFVICEGTSQRLIGTFNRNFTLLDRYVLDLSADPERRLDRRIAVALGVILDTGERR